MEVAYGTAANVGGGVLRPEEFYGNDTIVSVTVGVRVRWGRAHRVGRYGVLDTHEPQMAERIRGGRGTRRGGVR